MSMTTIDDLVRTLLGLELVNARQLGECQSHLGQAKNRPVDLLRLLEQKHCLTSYQVAKLKKGESDGLVLGRYKLLYRNAAGSFARVFRACSLDDDRTVGLKVLRQRWANDRRFVAQFRREAKLCSKLKHKNIVPIYEVGNHGEHHYFTMEFVEGGNLRDILNIRKRLSQAEASRCALDICQGLEYALGQGMTHGDLKPTNVLMSSQGVAKLVDFGLAGNEAAAGERSGDKNQQSIEYATLEKGSGASRDDPRSDLYFLGAIYYELLSGVSPFKPTKKIEERGRFERFREVTPLVGVARDVSQSAVRIVDRLMRLNPNERYQSPAEVAVDLNAAADEPTTPDVANSQPTRRQTERPATILCIESRAKQQDLLRDFLTRQGFRVLVMSDMQRGLNRLRMDPPDCTVFMGESIGHNVIDGFREAVRLSNSLPLASVLVLSRQQANWKGRLDESDAVRVLVAPVTAQQLSQEVQAALASFGKPAS